MQTQTFQSASYIFPPTNLRFVGADILYVTRKRSTALIEASRNGHLSMVEDYIKVCRKADECRAVFTSNHNSRLLTRLLCSL